MNVQNYTSVANILNAQMTELYGIEGAETKGVFEATDKGLTFTCVNGEGKSVSVAVEMPAIEPPDGEDYDPETLLAVIEKLDAGKLGLDAETEKKAQALIKDIAAKFRAAVEADKSDATNNNVFVDIYQLLALLAQCATAIKAAGKTARASAHTAQIQAINSQADKQVEAAWTGVWCSIACAAVQGIAQGIMTYIQLKNLSAQSGVAQENGVPMREHMLNNAALQGDPAAASKALQTAGKNLGIPQEDMKRIQADVTGRDHGGNPLTDHPVALKESGLRGAAKGVTDAKAGLGQAKQELETAKGLPPGTDRNTRVENAERNVAEKQRFLDEKETNLDQARGDYQKAMDGKVAKYEDNLARAEAKYKELANDPNADPAKLADAKKDLTKAQNELQYANAVRTNALSQSTGLADANNELLAARNHLADMQALPDSLKEKAEIVSQSKADLARAEKNYADALKGDRGVSYTNDKLTGGSLRDAKANLAGARDAAKNDPRMIKYERKAAVLSCVEKCLTIIGNAGNGITNSVVKMMEAEATRKQADQKKAEIALDEANEVKESGKELQQRLLQTYQAIQQAENESQRAIWG